VAKAGSVGRNWQFIAQFYRSEASTATAFASLPGARAGCFQNREGAKKSKEPV